MKHLILSSLLICNASLYCTDEAIDKSKKDNHTILCKTVKYGWIVTVIGTLSAIILSSSKKSNNKQEPQPRNERSESYHITRKSREGRPHLPDISSPAGWSY